MINMEKETTKKERAGIATNVEKAYIQKARPLQSLSETNLNLTEFKILDAYLARINSHDESKRTVKFKKGELEHFLGVTRIRKEDLKKRLKNLFQTVEVKDDRIKDGFKLINLFEKVNAEKLEDDFWEITLTCTASAKEYIFNIDNIGYMRYRLQNVINLTSRYSYVLFLYLLDNRFRKTWSVDLEELKKLLGCSSETYKQFKYLNDLILKKCQAEINEKTDITFEMETSRSGRRISDIIFTITSETKKIEFPNNPEEDTENITEPFDCGEGEPENILGKSANKGQYKKEEIVVLNDLLAGILPNVSNQERCEYLQSKINLMDLYDKKNGIAPQKKFGYLKKILENELESKREKKEKPPQKPYASNNRFNQFEQHDYDFDEIDRMLEEEIHKNKN